MDPLSEVLGRMRPSHPLARLATDQGEWCVQFKPHGYIKCYAVLSGTCWIAVEGGEPVELTAGDCVLLPGGRAFRIGSDLGLPAIPAEVYQEQRETRPPDRQEHVGANEVRFIGSAFTLPEPQAKLLLEALPPLIHLTRAAGSESLRWPLERMEQELRGARPGARLLAEHLAQVFLIHALRAHLDQVGAQQTGWLSALGRVG